MVQSLFIFMVKLEPCLHLLSKVYIDAQFSNLTVTSSIKVPAPHTSIDLRMHSGAAFTSVSKCGCAK